MWFICSETGTVLKYFLFFFILLIIPSCKDDPIAPPDNTQQKKDTVTVSVEDATLRSVTINIKTTNYNPPAWINLYRVVGPYQNVIARYPANVSDTSIYDDNAGLGLTINYLYKYYAALTDSSGKIKDTSPTVEARTLDTTSSNYTWELISVGEFTSELKGVWGSSDNDMWVFGGVYIDNKFYGGIHWDGYKWDFDSTVGGNAAHGFSKDNIWVCGGGVFNYDGTSWKRYEQLSGIGPKISIWGSSSNDIYVGIEFAPKLYHWDGQQRTEVLSENDRLFYDIAGFSATEVYALASRTANVEDRIYFFDGSTWSISKETGIAGIPGNIIGPNYSIWVKNSNEIYVAGRRIYKRINNIWSGGDFIPSSDIIKIRGTNSNNIVAMSANGSIYHYNGSTWKLIHTRETFYVLWGLFVTENKIYCVGYDTYNAKILIGTKQ